MREFIHCPDCLTVRMKVCKIVENGRTLQLVCDRCGRLEYLPVWGKSHNARVSRSQQELDKFLQMTSIKGTLKSVPPTHKRRR